MRTTPGWTGLAYGQREYCKSDREELVNNGHSHLVISFFLCLLSSFSGFGLALLAGLLYAFLFLPVAYLKLCDDSAHSCTGRCS